MVIVAKMLHDFSAFAHRSDRPISSFQVNDLINEGCTFLERFTRLKQVGFSFEPGEGLPAVYNDPALLLHVFYRLHCLCLDQLSAGQSLAVVTRPNQKTVEIVFHLPFSRKNLDNLFPMALQAAVEKLAGRLDTTTYSEDLTDIIMAIPSLKAP